MPTPFNYQNVNISNPYSGVAVTAPNSLKSATGQWWNTTVADPDIFSQSGNALSTVMPPTPPAAPQVQTPTTGTETPESGVIGTAASISQPAPIWSPSRPVAEQLIGGVTLADGRRIGGYYPWQLGQGGPGGTTPSPTSAAIAQQAGRMAGQPFDSNLLDVTGYNWQNWLLPPNLQDYTYGPLYQNYLNTRYGLANP